MSIAMKVVPNIEYAVKFAASNLSGPLSKDLKKLLWDVYVGKFNSVMEALDPFMEKWKRESEEFTKSIYLIKTSFFESGQKRDKMLNEAMNLILRGTKERMTGYARDLKSPITVLNALGILLPILGLIFFPIMSLFMPEILRPSFIILGYNIILPITVYWMMKNYLEKRPATFHQPDLSMHPKFIKEKWTDIMLACSTIIPAVIIATSFYQITLETEMFSFSSLVYSLIITSAFSGGIIIYAILTTLNKLKIRQEIVQIESELGDVLFQLGNQLTRGMPIENALKEILPKVKELKISKMFDTILYNMENFGMTFSKAVFDKDSGAIRQYPSTLIAAVMHAVTEIAKGGMKALSDTMLVISTYLKDMHAVELELEDTLSEVTSTMEMQSLLLAPLSAGIVVSMTAMVSQMLYSLKGAIDRMYDNLAGYGPLGTMGGGILDSIVKINEMMPIYQFQLIVGFYMIEIVALIAIFLSIIKFGGDMTLRKFTLGKMLLYGIVIYSVVMLLLYVGMMSIIPIKTVFV